MQEIDHFFGAPKAQTKIFAFLRRFRLKFRVSIESAEGASENFRVFRKTAAYDVIFQIPGGASAPPLRAPMVLSNVFRIQNVLPS